MLRGVGDELLERLTKTDGAIVNQAPGKYNPTTDPEAATVHPRRGQTGSVEANSGRPRGRMIFLVPCAALALTFQHLETANLCECYENSTADHDLVPVWL